MHKTKVYSLQEFGEDEYLYRYMKLSQFISMIETGSMYLTNTQRWEDPWERRLVESPIYINGKKSIFPKQSNMFAQCWTMSPESDAMWKIYSPNHSGVKIGIYPKSLLDFHSEKVHHLLLGLVDYEKAEMDRVELDNILEIGLIKRKQYEFEKEFRLTTCIDDDSHYIHYKVSLQAMICSIVIDPRADDSVVTFLSTLCSKLGLPTPIKSTMLTDSPDFSIHITEHAH